MVFFTCSHCGESLKKSKVEKHYQTYCSKKPVAITCVDCCKDFSAETYPAHTKCVSEEEKYSAKGFVPRPSTQKGEHKQKKWQDIIKSVHKTQSSLPGDERVIINAIVKRENVPRKKSKFQNFLRSCMKSNYSLQAADSIFDKLEALSKEEELKGKQNNQQEAENSGVIVGKNEIKANDDSLIQKENDDSATQETQAEEKLSKKERKERQKKAKYAAELKELEGNEMKENDDSPTQENQAEEKLSKKERKEKRRRARDEAELKELEGNEMKENDDSLIQKENDDSPTQENQTEEKLSKKERKERRKRAKYEAELKELQGNQVTQAEAGVENENEAGKKKTYKRGLTAVSTEYDTAEEQERSRKKHKADVIGAQNGISGDTEINGGGRLKIKKRKSKKQMKDEGVTDTGDAAVSDGGISKKKRKKGQDGVGDKCAEEPTNKKSKINDPEEMAEEDSPPKAGEKRKFNWQNIIIEVLKSKESNELPIKRLQKKVLAEFEAVGGGSAADVKIIAKFNKKVHKTPGVVIHKEIAKLSSLDR